MSNLKTPFILEKKIKNIIKKEGFFNIKRVLYVSVKFSGVVKKRKE
jgi:hypothetical protein